MSKRFFSLLVLAALLLPATAPSFAVEEGKNYYVAVSTTSTLNIRREPDLQSAIILERSRGHIVTATGKSSGLWIEVCIEPYIGWCMLSMLSLEEPFEDANGTVDANGRVAVRTEPIEQNASNKRREQTLMAWVQPGDELPVLSIVDYDGQMWYRVRIGKEKRGFILCEFLDIKT